MKSKYFFNNKYKLLIIVFLLYTGTDIILHKGQVCVLLPNSFDRNTAQIHLDRCQDSLIIRNKRWLKGVNTIFEIKNIDTKISGFEMDLYYDISSASFRVYHDSSAISETRIDEILDIYKERRMSASIWLDFKNLTEANCTSALVSLIKIRDEYGLHNKMIIESNALDQLDIFCENGFFTSFYVPFFNPYLLKSNELNIIADSMSNHLKRCQVSALSGYYFQYPFLEKKFPEYPILIWAADSKYSMVSYIFNRSLMTNERVKVVLY